MCIYAHTVAMELNDTLFSNHSSSNETRITGSDAEAATHPLVALVILFGSVAEEVRGASWLNSILQKLNSYGES